MFRKETNGLLSKGISNTYLKVRKIDVLETSIL